MCDLNGQRCERSQMSLLMRNAKVASKLAPLDARGEPPVSMRVRAVGQINTGSKSFHRRLGVHEK